MNKSELIDAVVASANISRKDATAAVNATFDAIIDSLKKGKEVRLIGFGTFEARQRKERQGHNPQNGETITIKASVYPGFRPGKNFKDALN